MDNLDWMVIVAVFVFAIIISGLIGGTIGTAIGSENVTMTKDSRDYRAMELELADVKARLATLERIKIEIELRDTTKTWFVYEGKVQ